MRTGAGSLHAIAFPSGNSIRVPGPCGFLTLGSSRLTKTPETLSCLSAPLKPLRHASSSATDATTTINRIVRTAITPPPLLHLRQEHMQNSSVDNIVHKDCLRKPSIFCKEG